MNEFGVSIGEGREGTFKPFHKMLQIVSPLVLDLNHIVSETISIKLQQIESKQLLTLLSGTLVILLKNISIL